MKLRTALSVSTLLVFTLHFSAQAYPRTMLLEELTSSTCPPCYSAQQWLDPYMTNRGWTNPQVIEYHMNWPSPGNDPWYAANPSDNSTRRAYYNVNGIPAMFIDGTAAQQPNYSPTQAQVQTLINQRTAVASPLWIGLSPTVSATGDSVILHVKVVSNTAISGNYRLRMFITEHHEHWSTPAPNNQTDFEYPMCIGWPDGSGVPFSHSGYTTDTTSVRAAFLIRSTGSEPYTIDNAGLVVFVQNDGSSTKEVLQAAYASIPLTSPNLSYAACVATDISGNHDGRIDAGESGNLTVTIANGQNFAPAVNMTAHLRTTVPGITLTDSVVVYGTLNGGLAGANDFHPFQIQLAQNFPPQYATFTLYVTADTSNYSTNLTFRVRLGRPQYLLVESDSTVDVASFYVTTLQNLGIDYDLWNLDSVSLAQSELLSYSKCIWFTGYRHNNILSPTNKASIEEFIYEGKKLLFTSQNALEWAVAADSDFARDYLRATLVSPSNSIHQFNGVTGDPYFDNMFLRTVGAGGASDADNPTSMQPRGNSVGMLQYNGISDFAGVYYSQGDARVVYLGIPFEAVSGSSSTPRDTLLTRINQYFDGALSTPDISGSDLPNRVVLSEAFPNPFNPTTTVRLSLPVTSKVSAVVYDIAGRQVKRLFAGSMNAGVHSFNIDISHQTSGVYFLRVEANGVTSLQKLVLMK